MKKLVEVLKPAKEKGKFICPACNGHNFSINKITGARKCWNGCSNESVSEAIKALMPETQKSDRTEKAPRERKTTEYFYNDRDGNPLIKVVKVVPGYDGKAKGISQYHWTGKIWKKGYGPVETPDIPLYRYAEVMAAIERGESIVLCEGESTADAFWEKGIPATTTIGGTSKAVTKQTEQVNGQKLTRFKRNPNLLESIKPALADLMGAEIILAPDRDKPGCLHSEVMADLLPVKGWLYALPENPQAWQQLPDKGGLDFVDWVHDYPNLTKQEILNYVVPAPTHQSPALDSPSQQLSLTPTSKKRPKAGALARQLHQRHPHLLFIADRKVWMLYEASAKGVWEEIPEEMVERLAMQLLDELECEELDSTAYITNVVKFLWMKTKAFRMSWKDADNNRYLPFTNGVLDLETNQLLEHDPKYHLTWTLPRPHNPEADNWETIDQWLSFAAQDSSNIRSILECFASAVLKGRADLQKFLHLMGIGGSGKGSYMRLITSLIGTNNVVTSNLEQFCINRFETARVQGKRLVLFSDERSKPRNISEFMKLTGQDALRCEKKQKEAFDFTYEGMVILASEFPVFHGEMGNGLKRRLIPLPMKARVEDKDRRDLQADFEPELAAFTNYLLSLSDEYVSETLRNVAETPEVKRQYWEARLREDSIAAWLDERLVYDPNGQISWMKLYEDYKDYCYESGNQAKSKNKFSDELMEVCQSLQWRVSKVKTMHGKIFKGVKLRPKKHYGDFCPQKDTSEEVLNDTRMTTLMTTYDDLDDDLNPDCTKNMTTMTTFSNLSDEIKKTEEKREEKIEKVSNPEYTQPQKLRSEPEVIKQELFDSWAGSGGKSKSVRQKDFLSRFESPDAVMTCLKKWEKARRVTFKNGWICNANSSVLNVGDEVEFTNEKGVTECGVIEAVNYPHYTISGYYRKLYLHKDNVKKRG